MTLTFVCQNCDDSFELDYSQLTEESKGLRCPNCGKKFPTLEFDEFVSTLDDLLTQVAAMRKRFVVSFDVDAEDLPGAFDADLKRGARGADEDEDESDEDEVLGDEDEVGVEEDEDERY